MMDTVRKDVEAILKVTVPEHEILVLAKESATTAIEKHKLERALAIHKKDAKDEIEDLQVEVDNANKIISTGKCEKKVKCVRVIELIRGELWFEFRGEIYDKRSLNQQELEQFRQETIPGT